jgi:hypothetical protein
MTEMVDSQCLAKTQAKMRHSMCDKISQVMVVQEREKLRAVLRPNDDLH